MAYWNLHQAYFLEVDLLQIPTDRGTLFIGCHVRIHVDFSSMIIFLTFRPSLSSVKKTHMISTFLTNEIS